MLLFDYTASTPAENLALDEALLETAELDTAEDEVLRLWEPTSPFVVLGRSSPAAREVNWEFCNQNNVPVVRRASGGQTVVAGPGCLMYAVILDLNRRPELQMVDRAHSFVLGKIAEAVRSLGIACEVNGISDLTSDGKKFGGNSLRCRRRNLVYHGTILYDLSIEFIANCLKKPVREPEYRQNRPHRNFLAPISVQAVDLKEAIASAWNVNGILRDWPRELMEDMARTKYGSDEWTHKVP
ncbi:MAG: lipoate--protein ligase family protein [Pirellulaceae bacterium]